MAKIDPAFQAAPNLGASSYDPIAFARRNRMEKFQIQRKQQEEQARNTAQGLENIMVDLKGLHDQEGFKEVLEEQKNIQEGALNLMRKGINIVSPQTTQDILTYKAVNDAHERLMEKVDTMRTNKARLDLMQKAVVEDSKLPEDQRIIDHEATYARVADAYKSSKGILDTKGKLDDLIVTKTKPVDIFKDIDANKGLFEKGTQTQHVVEMADGSKQVTFTEDLTPRQTEDNARIAGNIFESKPQAYKDAVRKIREADPNPIFNVMSDKDYYKTIAIPTYRKKFLEKPVGKGGSGFELKFGGGKTDIQPAEHQTNGVMIGNRVYNDRWDISATKAINFPINGGEYAIGEGGWAPIPAGGGIIEGQLISYIPETDMLIFRSTQDSRYPWTKNNTNIAIPRKNLANADKIPIKKEDGKVGTLKELFPTETEAPTLRTIGGKDFRDNAPYTPSKKK